MLHGKIEEMIDNYLIRDEELQEVIKEQRKDGYEEGMDITSNLYGLYNTVLIDQLVEAVDKIKALKDEMKEMQEHHQMQIKKLTKSNVTALNEKEQSIKEHLQEVSTKQREQLKRKDDECKKRQIETDIKWKEKEVEWIKQSMEYEQKIALIETALEDYDIQIKWTKGGFLVMDLMYDKEEEE